MSVIQASLKERV